MVLTDRDKEILKFMAKWRFITVQQLLKAGFYVNYKTCYRRLLLLRKEGLVNSGSLSNNTFYYHLTQRGGEKILLQVEWYSKTFRNAGQSTVLKCLVACDFALVNNIDFLIFKEIFERLKSANYDILKTALKHSDLYFEKNGKLYALIVDHNLSMKYLTNRIKLYSHLSMEIEDQLIVIFLLFNEVKRK